MKSKIKIDPNKQPILMLLDPNELPILDDWEFRLIIPSSDTFKKTNDSGFYLMGKKGKKMSKKDAYKLARKIVDRIKEYGIEIELS